MWWTPSALRSGGAGARWPRYARTTWRPPRCAPWPTGTPAWIRPGSTTSSSATQTRPARTTGTWPGWLLLTGFPTSVPGTTLNRLCGSGLEAVIGASRAIAVGDASICVAGGVESMSRAPWVLLKPEKGYPRGHETLHSTTLGWQMVNPRMPAEWTVPHGEGAEVLADRYKIDRAAQDAFALASHQRAAAAWDAGVYADEVVAVPGVELARDERIRADTSLDALGRLKPVAAVEKQLFGIGPVEAARTAAPGRHRLGRSVRRRAEQVLRGAVVGLLSPKWAGDLIGDAGRALAGRAALRGEVEPRAVRRERRPGDLRRALPGQPQERGYHAVRRDDVDLHVAAVLGDEEVAAGGAGDVVHAGERRGAAGDQRVVVDQVDALGGRVVRPDPVVALGGEPAGVAGVVTALAAVERLRPGDLVPGPGPEAVRVRHLLPADAAGGARRADQHLQRPNGKVAPYRRAEPVEAAVGLVLGQVDDLADRV